MMAKASIDNVLLVSFRQAITPDRMLGRMNATMRFVLSGALPVGSVLAGFVGENVSLRAALWCGTIGRAVPRNRRVSDADDLRKSSRNADSAAPPGPWLAQ